MDGWMDGMDGKVESNHDNELVQVYFDIRRMSGTFYNELELELLRSSQNIFGNPVQFIERIENVPAHLQMYMRTAKFLGSSKST